MLINNIEQISNTVNGYKIEDIILWTIGIFLAVISVIFSVLSYHFSNKSTKLITELMEKTWIITEADKILFINMKKIKNSSNAALVLLKSLKPITYEEYVSASVGSRIMHINKETLVFFNNTKYSDIIKTYLNEKKVCDDLFFNAVPIEKITSLSQDVMDEKERSKLISYHNTIGKFVTNILKEYTLLTL